jgi:ATP-dependent Clp protease ATP-binding subunit ClpC
MSTAAETQDRFTQSLRETIERAKQSVLKYQHTHITPEHLLLGLLSLEDAQVLRGLKSGKASPPQLRVLVERHLRTGDLIIQEDQLGFSERAKRAIEVAREESVRAQKSQIGPEHLLLGLAQVKNTVAAAVLAAVDLNPDSLRQALL